MEFTEECWVMRGIRLSSARWLCWETYVSRGTAGSVDFDWEKSWEDKSVVGWRHTHPGIKFDYPSPVDDRTMRSWVKATGKPMVCGVSCGDSTRYYLYKRVGRLEWFQKTELVWWRVGPFVFLKNLK